MVNLGLNESTINWKAEVKAKSNWVCIGVCLKELVKENNFKFTNLQNNDEKKSFFGISSNGFIWNRNNEFQNNKRYDNMKFLMDQIVHFSYSLKDMSLKITVNNNDVVLNGVFAENEMKLVPCVVFLRNGDSVKFCL